MISRVTVAAMTLALLVPTAPAMAESISKTVAAGRASNIDHYTGWNNDCSFKEIRLDVTAKPGHGSVSTRISKGRISAQADIGSSGACAGKPTKVLNLYYKPARGYHGTDSFTVNMTSGDKTQTYYYQITVR